MPSPTICQDTAWTYCLHPKGCPPGQCQKRREHDAKSVPSPTERADTGAEEWFEREAAKWLGQRGWCVLTPEAHRIVRRALERYRGDGTRNEHTAADLGLRAMVPCEGSK